MTLTFLLRLALFGLVVWLITQIPMPAQIRAIIIVLAVVFAVLWTLQLLGVNTGVHMPGLQ